MPVLVHPIFQFYDAVIPAYEHYVELSKAEELKKFQLMNAAQQTASLLFHFRETIVPFFEPNQFTRQIVGKMFADYDWVGDVTNAFKHTTINRKNPVFQDRSAIEETIVQTFFPNPDTPVYPRNFYGYMSTQILITPTKGEPRDLLEICTNVVIFWASFLVKQSWTKKECNYRYEGNDVLSPEQAKLKKLSSNVHVGVDTVIRCAMIARYFEPDTGKFGRWSFDETGKMLAVPVAYNAPNAKLYSNFST